jgi:hypothetical protein
VEQLLNFPCTPVLIGIVETVVVDENITSLDGDSGLNAIELKY